MCQYFYDSESRIKKKLQNSYFIIFLNFSRISYSSLSLCFSLSFSLSLANTLSTRIFTNFEKKRKNSMLQFFPFESVDRSISSTRRPSYQISLADSYFSRNADHRVRPRKAENYQRCQVWNMSIKRLENVGAPQGRGRWGEKFAFPRERQQTRENATVCANNARRSLVEDEKPRIDPPSSRSLFPPFPPLFSPRRLSCFRTNASIWMIYPVVRKSFNRSLPERALRRRFIRRAGKKEGWWLQEQARWRERERERGRGLYKLSAIYRVATYTPLRASRELASISPATNAIRGARIISCWMPELCTGSNFTYVHGVLLRDTHQAQWRRITLSRFEITFLSLSLSLFLSFFSFFSLLPPPYFLFSHPFC